MEGKKHQRHLLQCTAGVGCAPLELATTAAATTSAISVEVSALSALDCAAAPALRIQAKDWAKRAAPKSDEGWPSSRALSEEQTIAVYREMATQDATPSTASDGDILSVVMAHMMHAILRMHRQHEQSAALTHAYASHTAARGNTRGLSDDDAVRAVLNDLTISVCKAQPTQKRGFRTNAKRGCRRSGDFRRRERARSLKGAQDEWQDAW